MGSMKLRMCITATNYDHKKKNIPREKLIIDNYLGGLIYMLEV